MDRCQWWIQDFPRRGRQPSLRGHRDTILLKISENCMKSRKIWSLGGIRHWMLCSLETNFFSKIYILIDDVCNKREKTLEGWQVTYLKYKFHLVLRLAGLGGSFQSRNKSNCRKTEEGDNRNYHHKDHLHHLSDLISTSGLQ